jgi:hypothetical protein
VFEQEGAADTEVDALQLDKRHLPIVAGGLGKAASTSGSCLGLASRNILATHARGDAASPSLAGMGSGWRHLQSI